MTALEVAVPTARIRELRPFADAVSVTGTAPMISEGMAAYATPTPAPMITDETMSSKALCIRKIVKMYPAAITAEPAISVGRGPMRAISRADTGESSIMTSPFGASVRPDSIIVWPRP